MPEIHVAVLCSLLLLPINVVPAAQAQEQPAAGASDQQEPAAKIPPDQLDSLVAPIALYPDPMLAQVLAGFDVPARDCSTPAMAGEKQNIEG